MLIPPPPVQTEMARSLPARVPDTPGHHRDQGPRTPRTPRSKNAPRFYPVMKEGSHIPDPQVIGCFFVYFLTFKFRTVYGTHLE